MNLKKVRVIVSLLLFLLFLGSFLLPPEFAGKVSRYFMISQWFPALDCLLKSNILVPALIAVPLLTLLFGRIYCSSVCPLGTCHDALAMLSPRRRRRRRFHPLGQPARFAVPAVAFMLLLFGVPLAAAIFEPYSAAGRLVNNLLRPVLAGAENLLSHCLKPLNIYVPPFVAATGTGLAIITGLFLIMLAVMAVCRGRLYCNLLCPVGAILALPARFSLFAVRLDGDRCVSCGQCEKACKSECIDVSAKKIDISRCVSCFNCVAACPTGAVRYRFRRYRKAAEVHTDTAALPGAMNKSVISRRDFIGLTAVIAATVPVSGLLARPRGDGPITPPGALGTAHFTTACTACHLCVANCPEKVLRPAWFEYGIGGMFQPRLDYDKAFCAYDCNLCSQVCPTGAIRPVSLKQKQKISIGTAVIRREHCIVYKQGLACGACAEICPTGAVAMSGRFKKVMAPVMREAICIGCGACQNVCPAIPDKAIIVVAREVHQPITPDAASGQSSDSHSDFAF